MMMPSFLKRLADPAIQNILICGCGGGFDFVHGLLLYPDLVGLGKTIVIGSFSFGDPDALRENAPVVYDEPPALVKRVSAVTAHTADYAPEIHVCSFLDARYANEAPHFIYAYSARDFTVGTLTRLYRQLAGEHDLDAVVLVDGGSDSLAAGDEYGLGDPVEDAVSVQSVATLTEVPFRILISAGLGVDRHNGVSDHTSFKAVAELTERGGFLGAVAIEPDHPGAALHRDCVAHIAERQKSGSVVAGAILDAARGGFGTGKFPGRASPATVFLWPPMSVLWAFDVEAVAARSRVCEWIRDAETPGAAHAAVRAGRHAIEIQGRDEERFPEPAPSPFASIYDPPD